MSLVDIILTIIIIASFCLGFRTLLSDGMIFHFIRRPFEYEKDSKMMNFYREKLRQYVLVTTENAYSIRKKFAKKSDILSYLLKPFILCVVCFPSIWGTSIFLLLHGFQLKELIICIISSTFIIKLINDKMDW